MTSELPPGVPPPPAGPPPAGPPPAGPPELLEQGPDRPSSGRSSAGRKAVIIGGAVVGLGAVAGAVAGAMWYFGTGPQPAQALPDSTVAYLSVDIDPSGKQLLAARDALESFPFWTDQEISDRDDLREAIFDELLADAPCEVTYDDDVEPWIGDRAALAAVDLGNEEPDVVTVVQVTDVDAAEAAFERFSEECGGETPVGAGWAVSGEWAVLAESEDIATEVAEAAQDRALSGDDDFERWTEEAGDPGILTAYLAPEAGPWLVEHGPRVFGGADTCLEELGRLDCDEPGPDEVAPELREVLDDFEGAALTLRFDDGGLELETATGIEALDLGEVADGDSAGETMETLPEDTAAAVALGLPEGWVQTLLDRVESASGMDLHGLVAGAGDELGLDLPEDVETLTGESVALAIGGEGLDIEPFDPGFRPSDLPIGLKIKGDAEEIEEVIDEILGSGLAAGPEAELLGRDSAGDFVALGPSSDYRERLLEDRGLGGSATYRDVVEESDDAAAIVYVNFDAGGGWLEEMFAGDGELRGNLEPLRAAGLSSWVDDGVGHAVLRVTLE